MHLFCNCNVISWWANLSRSVNHLAKKKTLKGKTEYALLVRLKLWPSLNLDLDGLILIVVIFPQSENFYNYWNARFFLTTEIDFMDSNFLQEYLENFSKDWNWFSHLVKNVQFSSPFFKTKMLPPRIEPGSPRWPLNSSEILKDFD